MLSLFKKKEVNIDKVNYFCEWFVENNKRIIESVNNSSVNHEEMMKVLDEVQNELRKVYSDAYKGDIQFEYGFNGKKWDLNLFHLNKEFLIKATTLIANQLTEKLSETWMINIGK